MRRSGIERNPDKIRAWQNRSRRPLPRQSARRTAAGAPRAEVRRLVLARDHGCVAEGLGDIPHGRIGDRAWLEVHELSGGARRGETFLLPEWCVALCPLAHDWVTGNPLAAERRGLRLPGHGGEDLLTEAALIRSLWSVGEVPPFPSWWGPHEIETCRAIEAAL